MMEQSLNMPIRQLLPIMQSQIGRSKWFGIDTWKGPIDAWVYQELIHDLRPDWIIEIGSYAGGSTLMLANFCDLLGHGQVLAIEARPDRIHDRARDHPRVTILGGEALDVIDAASTIVSGSSTTLIIEDSSHKYDNTLEICRQYGDLVTPGSYLIIEDGICHHGLEIGPKPGPYEAVATFLAENDQFVADRTQEKFLITWNPNGYLRKVA